MRVEIGHSSARHHAVHLSHRDTQVTLLPCLCYMAPMFPHTFTQVYVVPLRSHQLCTKGICVILMLMFVTAVLYNSRTVSSGHSEFVEIFYLKNQREGL